MRLVLILLAVAASLASSATAQGDRYTALAAGGDEAGGDGIAVSSSVEMRLVSVAELFRRPQFQALPRLGRALAEYAWQPEDSWASGEDAIESRMLFPKTSTKILADHLHNVDDNIDEIITATPQGKFLLSGSAQTLDRAAAVLRYVSAMHVPRIRVEFVVVDDGEVPVGPLGVDGAQLFDAVLAGKRGRLIDFATIEGRVGDELRAGVERLVSTPVDLDVEIAQEATAFDPIVVKVPAGRLLTACGILTPTGDLALLGLYTDREITQQRRVTAGEIGALQASQVRQSQQSFCLRAGLQQGVALAPNPMQRPDRRVLLRATRLDRHVQPPAGRLAIPLSILDERKLNPMWGPASKDWFGVDAISDILRRLVRDDKKADVSVLNHVLHVRGDQTVQDQAQGIVKFFTKQATRQFEVRLTREALVGEQWSQLGGPLSLFSLSNRTGFGMVGEERMAVTDYDVEVAQKAETADPVIRACFDGLEAWSYVTCADGFCEVNLRVVDRVLGRLQSVAAPAKLLGRIEVPNQGVVKMERVLRMKPGESRILGRLPAREVKGKSRAIRLRVELREIR